MSRADLQAALPPGAARCALDCALWDLHAKATGKPVWQLAQMSRPRALTTAFTVVLDGADAMAHAATQARAFPLLKVKLGSREGVLADVTRLREIRRARPDAKLIVDANEGWSVQELARYAHLLAAHDVMFFEQPVATREQDALSDIDLPFCADESVHETSDLETLPPAYGWVNVKLDKAGGFTQALEMVKAAKSRNLNVMIGCMVASSLSIAPAHLLAQLANLADLDGPLWLTEERPDRLVFDGPLVSPPAPSLWG
jgi:L-alanine-DL-glutamate epimerase-like enolase superfamily enzyme